MKKKLSKIKKELSKLILFIFIGFIVIILLTNKTNKYNNKITDPILKEIDSKMNTKLDSLLGEYNLNKFPISDQTIPELFKYDIIYKEQQKIENKQRELNYLEFRKNNLRILHNIKDIEIEEQKLLKEIKEIENGIIQKKQEHTDSVLVYKRSILLNIDTLQFVATQILYQNNYKQEILVYNSKGDSLEWDRSKKKEWNETTKKLEKLKKLSQQLEFQYQFNTINKQKRNKDIEIQFIDNNPLKNK